MLLDIAPTPYIQHTHLMYFTGSSFLTDQTFLCTITDLNLVVTSKAKRLEYTNNLSLSIKVLNSRIDIEIATELPHLKTYLKINFT